MPKNVVVITGTSRGIGRALAEHYLAKHWLVVGTSRAETTINHESYIHFRADLTLAKERSEFVANVLEQYGAPLLLINNAGVARMNHSLLATNNAIDSQIDLNLKATIDCSAQFGKRMIVNRKGVIINFTTVAVPLKLEGEAIYSASKAAVEQFTKVFSKEVGPFNVRVNCIGPCPVKTDLIAAVPESKLDDLIGKQSLKYYGTYDDIFNVVDWFASDESKMITGQTIYLGGIG